MFAQEIVARFHSKQDAEMALADFEARFRRGGLPDDMLERCCILKKKDCLLPSCSSKPD